MQAHENNLYKMRGQIFKSIGEREGGGTGVCNNEVYKQEQLKTSAVPAPQGSCQQQVD